MNLSDFCHRDIATIDRDSGVVHAALQMREQHVGSLIIVDRDGEDLRPVGILTDRDLAIEALTSTTTAQQLHVSDIMSDCPATALVDDDALATLHRMRTLGIRRMPIVDHRGSLKGIIAVDDLLQLLAASLGDVAALIVREAGREVVCRS